MKVTTLSNKTYQLSDVEKILSSKKKEFCFRILSAYLVHIYNNDYQKYLNFVQFIPGVINSFLLFANGMDETFTDAEFEALVNFISSLDIDSNSSSGKSVIYQSYIKVHRNLEHANYILGRIGYIFEWLKINKEKFEFKEITKFSLEDILLVFWGAFAVNDSGKRPAFIDPTVFFTSMKLNKNEIEEIVKIIDSKFSVDIKTAEFFLNKSLAEKGKKFNGNYTIFEDKPFLKIGGSYLLIAPHFAINNLISICSKFFIEQFNVNANNQASAFYGNAFESYCSELIKQTLKKIELEPKYYNSKNECGPDLIYINKGKIPVLFEFHKSTVYKSIFYDFSIDGYNDFLQKKVIVKFEQIFKWMKSHNYKYNSVDLWEELDRTQFVIVLAQSLPLTCFNEIQEIILKLVNLKWVEVSGQSSKLLKWKNVYVLGVGELELLVGFCKLKNQHLPLKLFEFKQYQKFSHDIKISKDDIEIRKEFEPWLMEAIEYKELKNDLNKKHNKEIFKKMLNRINVSPEELSQKLEDFDDM